MFISNDYLSISNHPSILSSQLNILQSTDTSVLMSAIFLQEHNLQSSFEKKLAKYVGFEDSILCQSGWVANVGLIQSIADENTPVYIDMIAHMSLWEGIKSAGAKAYPFRHNDYTHLEKLIKAHGIGIILIDSVYSTNGNIGKVAEIVDIGNKYDCIIVVDESHSLGTHGYKGSGLVAELGLTHKVNFITASLAKAFAGRAGVIICSKEFTKYFPYISNPAIFSSALLPYEIVGLVATLNLLIDSDDKRKEMNENADYFRNGLDSLGYNVSDSQSQIVSLEPGLENFTEITRDALEKRNIFGSVFCRPATAKNRSLIRFSVNSSHTKENLDYVLKICEEMREEVNMKSWRSTKRKI